MYIILEYLTYLTLVALFGLALFMFAAALLLSRTAASIAASLARRTAAHALLLASKYASFLSIPGLQRSH